MISVINLVKIEVFRYLSDSTMMRHCVALCTKDCLVHQRLNALAWLHSLAYIAWLSAMLLWPSMVEVKLLLPSYKSWECRLGPLCISHLRSSCRTLLTWFCFVVANIIWTQEQTYTISSLIMSQTVSSKTHAGWLLIFFGWRMLWSLILSKMGKEECWKLIIWIAWVALVCEPSNFKFST